MVTNHQLIKHYRIKKVRRNKVASFVGAPLRKAIVYKIAIMSPTLKPF